MQCINRYKSISNGPFSGPNSTCGSCRRDSHFISTTGASYLSGTHSTKMGLKLTCD